ncbi:MAG: undecaprenyl/decaprenyl-phosphate alpha-N-acetylglucosaminyl 1-phosphate transferase [Clostridiales bacterium]|nr:undecaprenyl/decaprenyl-phosphate alpha-N-acetylglucosaminyl 1-phosphate transferase [Clostridiales bacterium]
MFENISFTKSDFIYVAVIAASFLVACLLTPLMRKLATKYGIVDSPDGKRKFQKEPVPYMGGLAILAAFIAGSSVLWFASDGVSRTYIVIFVGVILTAALGLIDDIIDMKPPVKFAGQVLIALGTVIAGGAMEYIEIFGHYVKFGIFSYPISVLWIVLVVNAVNMLDGLDGLACGTCALSLMTLFVSALVMNDGVSALICAALCGAALGFLPYNLTPASIFMGDSGAMALGYVMASVSLFGFFKGPAFFSIIVPALALALPVADAVELFFARLLKGRNPFSSDRLHIHHKLVDMGLSPRAAVLVLYVITSAFSISAIVYIKYKLVAVIIAGAALAILIALRFIPIQADRKTVQAEAAGEDKK